MAEMRLQQESNARSAPCVAGDGTSPCSRGLADAPRAQVLGVCDPEEKRFRTAAEAPRSKEGSGAGPSAPREPFQVLFNDCFSILLKGNHMTRVFMGALSALALLTAATQSEAAIGVTYHYASGSVPAGGTKSYTRAYCNTGEVLVGGGWYGTDPNLFVYRSRPQGDPCTGWAVGARNYDTNYSHDVYAFAVCATGVSQGQGAHSHPVTQDVVVSAGGNGKWGGNPGCSGISGSSLSAGGFSSSVNTTAIYPISSHPVGTYVNNWETYFYNPGNATHSFTAYAVCVQNLGVNFDTTIDKGERATIPPDGSYPAATETCGSGSGYGYRTSGGFSTDLGSLLAPGWVYGSQPVSQNQWYVYFHNGDHSRYANVFAYTRCFHN
jgi:hypothetical protein